MCGTIQITGDAAVGVGNFDRVMCFDAFFKNSAAVVEELDCFFDSAAGVTTVERTQMSVLPSLCWTESSALVSWAQRPN